MYQLAVDCVGLVIKNINTKYSYNNQWINAFIIKLIIFMKIFLGIKQYVVDMILSYNPLWLRIGLEVSS